MDSAPESAGAAAPTALEAWVQLPANGTVPVVLVANRAEIACRIIKACHKLHLKAVAVYTDPGTAFVCSVRTLA